MSLTYVIPDLHGRYDLLNDALAGIAAHSRGETGTIVTIGDYVDKGPDSKAVIDRLLPGVGAGWNLVALKGNHDSMMLEALRDPSKMAAWLGKGGDAALASFGGDPAGVPQSHVAWLDRLRCMSMHIGSTFTPASIPKFRWIGRARRRCCGSAIRRDILMASVNSTSSTATIIFPMARCYIKAAPTWTRWPGGRDG